MAHFIDNKSNETQRESNIRVLSIKNKSDMNEVLTHTVAVNRW